MSGTRRRFFHDAALFGAGLFGLRETLRAGTLEESFQSPRENENGRHHSPYGSKGPHATPGTALVHEHALPMATPDLTDLPHEMDGSVKVFHLVAEPVKRKIAPFKTIDAWGYNGSCPGPAIQVQQGDRVRVVFENHLPESTSLHWHGLEIPIEQDGVPYISQKPVAPGEKYVYEFTVHQEGTFFYHAHSAMQEMMGLIGFIVAHPEIDYKPRVDHDYGLILQEWAVLPSNTVPNTAAMEFNWLTFNGVSAPMTTPLLARLGSREIGRASCRERV
jgi:FtsP/CotA-like multicopper oxidase with cupredoxin domain